MKNRILRLLSTCFSVALLLLSNATMAWAQSPRDEKGPNFVLGYALVIILIMLGLAAVCRQGNRDEKPKMVAQDLERSLEKIAAEKSESTEADEKLKT
ncbi:MAG: hypothetical protein N2C12_13855 [Planctomycetales bacterium]